MIATRISRLVALISAAVLLPSLAAFACDGPACPCQSLDQALAALSVIEVHYSYPDEVSATMRLMGDQEFVREAFETSAAGLELGQLAQQKSQSADIQEFGRKIAQDHADFSTKVMVRVAKLMSVDQPKGLSKRHKQLLAGIAGLSGAEFDQQFIKLMVRDEKQDLKKFTDEANLAQDPSVKVAAEYGSSLIVEHLKLIEQIAERRDVIAKNQAPAIRYK